LALLLIVHAALALGIVWNHFAVVDEVGHVPAGVSHWRTGDFRAYNVNPPLGRMLAALPVLACRPRLDLRPLDSGPGMRPEWRLGIGFANDNADRYVDLIRLARLSGIAWSLVGAWLVARWARDLYGEPAGILAAALWCLDPTILTFASFVTPDVPATVAGLAATYAFWRYLRRPSWELAAASGLLLGIAQLTKFTMLALYGIWPFLWLLRCRRVGGTIGRGLWWRHAAGIVALSLVVINAGYGFRDSLRPLGEPDFVSRLFGGTPPNRASFEDGLSGNRSRGTWAGMVPIPLPSEYLEGIDVQRRDFENGFPSYLAGRWRNHGWWYYYLDALAVKEPIGLLVLVALSLVWTVARQPGCAPGVEEATLLIPAGAFLTLVSSQTGFSHHMRYVLPMYPFVFISTGKLAVAFRGTSRRMGAVVLGLLAWSVASVGMAYPHLMSYFNEAAGGPSHGGEHLLDSNMDWGQDLLALKRWLDRHPEARPLGLAYFNVVDPRIVGISYSLPPPGPNGLFPGDCGYQARFGPRPGYYAVSVAYLQGTSFNAPDGHGGYRRIARDDFAYFRRFRPIARAGYSILIYRITAADANVERRRLDLPPVE
jgi:4-amino-4-deoxy-L-arabinose transferase-like glycosyltransferase